VNDKLKGLGDLPLLDLFAKHGLNKENRRKLSEEEKRRLKDVVEELYDQAQKVLGRKETPAAAPDSTETLKKVRKGLHLKFKK